MRIFKAAAMAASAAAVLFVYAPHGQAQTTLDPETQTKILKGLAIAPVPLNMTGKDPNFVGYGSYIVNASADCNGCHTANASVEYANGGNPYFSQHPAVVNPKAYLGGGNDFGAFPDPTGNFPHIISRNITPDATGMPEGHTYDQFVQIIRTGIDMDNVHPTCKGAPDGTCLPPPFDGSLLQIMPWPTFANMTDNDLQAIYAYLSAIPCLEGGPGELPNRCGTATPKTLAVAGPKSQTVITRQYQLDGTQSKAFDGGQLSYQWTIPQGSPQAGISGATTATPTVQFGIGRGMYTFQLTITDSAGKTAADMVGVNFAGN
ncbi:MAG: hypothetical protein JO307_06195 [Bryobacterales bacterium]|nr:hypothetical protein [Bryobacterales bacterium]MBV9397114.1 hypothetical protein [Bryobacterales bacterium]